MMTLRGWSRLLGGLLGSLWMVTVWGAEIVDRPGVGAKSYIETFDVWQDVDTSAGLTPYLDESTVFAGALEQISSISGSLTVPFDAFPGAYDFDDSKIIFENGEATLRPDPLWPSVLATWRFEEAAWDGTAGEVSDSAGSASGSIVGQAQTILGQIGRAASFDGQGDAVVLGQGGGLALDPSQEFTLSAWFRTHGDGALIAKADSDFGSRQFYLFVAGGRLWGAVGGSQHQGLSSGVSDGQWHHGVLVNRDEGGTLRFTLYLDGVVDGTFDSGTAGNAADVLLGARRDTGNSGLAFELSGDLDEVSILNQALSDVEVQDLYAGGAGRALSAYPGDGPSITNNFGTRLFGVSDFRAFEATPSASHAGGLGFQVSVDGESWQFWNGSAWQVTADGSANDAATIEANLSALDWSGGTYFYVRTFLLSDGTQPAGIDRLFWAYDFAPVVEAREILGPVSADLAFESLQAEITDTDGNVDVRLRLLQDDAETPVDEGLLPGNATGFYDDDLSAPGVDLSGLPGGSYYVEVIFENPLGRYSDSARLESFQVDFQESLGTSDGTVQLSGGIEPLKAGQQVDLTLQVQNLTSQSLAEPSLELTLPAALSVSSWTPPAGWTCEALQCTALSLDAGSTDDLLLTLQVETVSTSQAVTVSTTVDGLNDTNTDNNTASIQLALDPAVQPRALIIHQADPADGTDVTYDFLEGPSLVLDDAEPDDGDGFGDQGEVFLEADRSYTLDPSLPVGWLLDDVQCSAPARSASFQEPFSSDVGLVYDAVALEVADGVVRLRQDPLVDHVLAQWRFEEASWNGTPGEVEDSSGSGLTGGALGDANTLADGLLGGAATFDGQGDAVLLGQPAALDLQPTQAFTVSLWFRTLGNGALIAKADGDFNQRQFYLFVIDDRLWGTVGGSQHNGGTLGVSDGQWHHAALVNAGGGSSTFTLYLDGQPDGTFSAGSATNGLDVLLGARRDQGNNGLAFQLDGELDEVTLLDRALTAEEILSLYADGSGRLLGGFPDHGPSIAATLSPVDSGWTSFSGFEEELGLAHAGQVTYQLSTDGNTWQWFDGGAWSPVQGAPSPAQSNDGSTVNANISSLSYDPGQGELRVRAFLQSDGSQQVELDRLRVLYTSDGLGGVAALNGASIDTALSPDVTCQFSWIVDPNRYGSMTLVQTATPADGTDFAYNADFGGQQESFVLDAGNDGDGVASTRTWSELDPGPVSVAYVGSAAGWYLDSITCEDPVGSVFVTPFDLAESYTYDGSIEVTAGVARLQSDALAADLLGYWPMDEDSWTATPVVDDSGQGQDGSALGQADTVSGLIGRAGRFDGQGDAVLLGQSASLDLTGQDDFTVSAWFRTAGDGAIVGKAEDAFGARQVYLFMAGGQVHANVGGVQNAGSGSFGDNEWHHVVLINEASAGEHHLYVDGVLRGTFPSGSAINSADWMIGARRQSGNVGTAFELSGEVDEVAIFGRALDLAAIDSLYANGDGRALGAFPTAGPSIIKTVGDSAPYLRLRSFTVLGDTDRLAFQLSTDGATWRYWDGFFWQPAAHDGQRNDAATVNAHISQLDTSSESIFVRSFLLSDGTQSVSLDEIQVGYDQLSGVSTEVEFDQGSISLDLQGGQNVQCTVHHVLDAAPSGSLRLRMEADPSWEIFPSSLTSPDGSVEFFDLEDGAPYLAQDLVGGTYQVTSALPLGWERRDVQCFSGPVGDSGFRFEYGSPDGFQFDADAIEMTGELARLRGDALWPDLLAYWRLDAAAWSGAAGEVLDASGNGHHGVAVGASTTDGLLGRAGDFGGSSAHVSLGSPPELDLQPGSDPFTVAAWFRTTGNGAIVGKAGGSLAQRQFYLFVLDGKLWSIVGGELNSMTSSVSVTDGAWHHAALVSYESGGVMRHTLYLDGQPAGDFASGSATNGADLMIGARRADDAGGGVAFPLQGQVDEVMIFGRGLDDVEVASLYADGAGRQLAAYPTSAPSIFQTEYRTGNVREFIGFSETFGPDHAGEVEYQVDLGDGVWLYWDGASLTTASAETDRNSLADLHTGLRSIGSLEIRFRLKAFLVSDGAQGVELDRATLFYHHGYTVDYEWQGESLQVHLDPGQEASCHFENEQVVAESVLSLFLESEPADGTNFRIDVEGVTYFLDDARPDDIDGDDGIYSFLDLPYFGDQTIHLQLFGALYNGLRSVQCSGNAIPEEYFPNTRELIVHLQSGEYVYCDLSYERWGQQSAVYENLTLSADSNIGSYAVDAVGRRLMTSAIDDFAGDNPEKQPEIFSYDALTAQWQSLTIDSHTSSERVDVAANGQWGVIPMSWDPFGSNSDRNGEVFRFDLVTRDVTQVTTTVGCDSFTPAVSDDGTKVAMASDCHSADGSMQIVLMDGFTPVTMAPTSGCDSRFPKISADGGLVTFESNCDWLGLNPDGGREIFQWRWQDGPAAIEQWTDVDSSTGVYVSSHQVSDDGRFLFVASNQGFDGSTLGYDTIQRLDQSTGERLWFCCSSFIFPFTISGVFDTPFVPMAVDGTGRHVAFYGYSALTDVIGRWYWGEMTEAGDFVINDIGAGTVPEAHLALLGRAHVGWDAAATPAAETPTIYVLSDWDFDGSNPDGKEDIWRVTFE